MSVSGPKAAFGRVPCQVAKVPEAGMIARRVDRQADASESICIKVPHRDEVGRMNPIGIRPDNQIFNAVIARPSPEQ
jgi:hypothetical protein